MSLPQQPRVLCISHDPHLLRTRGLVLATRYHVVPADSIEEVQTLLPDEKFDLIVLCHTLSFDECDRCVEIARTRWPEAKIVALSVERLDCSDHADRVVRGIDGPTSLLGTIDGLLVPPHWT